MANPFFLSRANPQLTLGQMVAGGNTLSAHPPMNPAPQTMTIQNPASRPTAVPSTDAANAQPVNLVAQPDAMASKFNWADPAMWGAIAKATAALTPQNRAINGLADAASGIGQSLKASKQIDVINKPAASPTAALPNLSSAVAGGAISGAAAGVGGGSGIGSISANTPGAPADPLAQAVLGRVFSPQAQQQTPDISFLDPQLAAMVSNAYQDRLAQQRYEQNQQNDLLMTLAGWDRADTRDARNFQREQMRWNAETQRWELDRADRKANQEADNRRADAQLGLSQQQMDEMRKQREQQNAFERERIDLDKQKTAQGKPLTPEQRAGLMDNAQRIAITKYYSKAIDRQKAAPSELYKSNPAALGFQPIRALLDAQDQAALDADVINTFNDLAAGKTPQVMQPAPPSGAVQAAKDSNGNVVGWQMQDGSFVGVDGRPVGGQTSEQPATLQQKVGRPIPQMPSGSAQSMNSADLAKMLLNLKVEGF